MGSLQLIIVFNAKLNYGKRGGFLSLEKKWLRDRMKRKIERNI
jgi:hypothetical protein